VPLQNTYMVMEDHGFLVVVGKEAKMSQMVYIYSANESMVESPVDGSARRQLILPAMCVDFYMMNQQISPCMQIPALKTPRSLTLTNCSTSSSEIYING